MSKTQIQITKIECLQVSEPFGDNVYLICQADGGVPIPYPPGIMKLKSDPHHMSNNETWPSDPPLSPPLKLSFEYEVLVTLWDSDVDDDPTVASFLGSQDFTPADFADSDSISKGFATPGDAGFNATYNIYATKISS